MEAFVELLLQMRSKEPTRIDLSEVNWLHKIYDQFALFNNMLSFSVESCVAVVTIRFTEAFTSSIDEATPAAQKLAHSEKKERRRRSLSFESSHNLRCHHNEYLPLRSCGGWMDIYSAENNKNKTGTTQTAKSHFENFSTYLMFRLFRANTSFSLWNVFF